MARWRLAAPHYLTVPGNEWEYKETDRQTNKPKRVTFPVPMLLNPDDPSDWNYKHGADQGEVIVTDGKNAQPKDIVFKGEPTPDMVPLDDEAKAISAKLEAKWKHPIDSLPGTYGEALLDQLQKEVAEVQATAKTAPVEGMTELLAAMTAMMKQNQELLAALVAKPAAAPAQGIRR